MKYKAFLALSLLLVIVFFSTSLILLARYIPDQAESLFGPPDRRLDFAQRLLYSARVLLYQNELLTANNNKNGQSMQLTIKQGQTADQVAQQLIESGLISNTESFLILLKYRGLDDRIRAGDYSFSAAINALQIVEQICDLTPDEVSFVILPGMRAEEIAALLPTSVLDIDLNVFLELVKNPPADVLPEKWKLLKNLEGFLSPGEYQFKRTANLDEFLKTILMRFDYVVTAEMISGWQKNNLTPAQGVILASIIQREMVLPQEAPMIASVFVNRSKAGLKLDSDATVQYVVGTKEGGWWRVPLTSRDFEIVSTFNTYKVIGLPPTAICNPGLDSLKASAFPAASEYYYFQAKCDGSGAHQFFKTYDEQLANLCQKSTTP